MPLIPPLTPEQKAEIQDRFHIPVDDAYPRSYWIMCLDIHTEMPTDAELAVLRSHCEFVVKSWYNQTYQHKILVEMRLPADSGHNTVIFRKRDGLWSYRRSSWETGYWPYACDTGFPLLELMDHERSFANRKNPKWEDWKNSHPCFAELKEIK